MINYQSFTKEWIIRQAKIIHCKSPVLLEKAIIALQLLCYLAESDMSFQFKGGTSLLLRFDPIKRLSIDIDIVTQSSKEGLLVLVEKISKQKPFEGFVTDERIAHDSTPKSHYKFFYSSQFYPADKKDNLLLDVIFDAKGLPGYNQLIIKKPFIMIDYKVMVTVPTINCILGEKLTAFAPTTIGIKYNPDRKMEIIKQLFDIGELFDVASDMNEVKKAYEYTHSRQNVYRDSAFTFEQTLLDSIQAGFELSQFDPNEKKNTENSVLLREGVISIQNHLLQQKFTLNESKIASGKVACICSCILHSREGVNFEQLRYQPKFISNLRSVSIADPWQSLNSLKPINTEAFYYWYQAQQLLNGGQIIQ